jgi:C1A family cysteine protease
MRKAWLIVLVTLLLLTSCIQKPNQTQTKDESEFPYALGCRPLPEDFVKWWFDNLEDIKSGRIDVIDWSGETKLIVHSQDIARTQRLLTNPELTALPPYYLAPHTPPKNQGQHNTCWAFATVGSLESALLTQLSLPERVSIYPFFNNPSVPDLSEQFLAYYNIDSRVEKSTSGYRVTCQETNRDAGGNLFFSTYNLIRRGVPIESDLPYIITSESPWIQWNATNNDWKRHLVRSSETVFILNYKNYSYSGFGGYVNYIETIKSAIMKYGALAVGFQVYSNFYNFFTNVNVKVYTGHGPEDQPTEGHAVLLVGWKDSFSDSDQASGDSGRIWILKNSWGTDWGRSLKDYGLSDDETKGYFALPMITQEEFANKNCPDWKIENSLMVVPIVDQQKPYVILADHEEHTVGRISYIDVKVVDENGRPVPNVGVRMFYQAPSDGNWYPVVDVFTGQSLFTTNENGIAKAAVLPNVQVVNQKFYAYVPDNPSSEAVFTVTFKKPAWLFLVWMCADNNLERYANDDLIEMQNTNPNVSVITLVDGNTILRDSIRMLDEFGQWQTFEYPYEDFDSGDYTNLRSFVSFFKSVLQASNYALIIWDHGSAWIDDHKSTRSYSPQAIAFDDTSRNRITTPELRMALEEAGGVDLLGMDACLMGSIEVLYELKDVAGYVVASSFIEPGTGWNYEFFKQITSTDNEGAVGRKIVDAYRVYYDGTSWESIGLSLAVYNMSKVAQTASALNSLSLRLIEIMNPALRSTIHYFYPLMSQYLYNNDTNERLNTLVDLRHFVVLAQGQISDGTAIYWAGQVLTSLPDLVSYYYVEKTGETIQYPVSIFMPNSASLVSHYAKDYNSLLFTNELYWSNFLESWLETGDVLRSISFEPSIRFDESQGNILERLLKGKFLHNK